MTGMTLICGDDDNNNKSNNTMMILHKWGNRRQPWPFGHQVVVIGDIIRRRHWLCYSFRRFVVRTRTKLLRIIQLFYLGKEKWLKTRILAWNGLALYNNNLDYDKRYLMGMVLEICMRCLLMPFLASTLLILWSTTEYDGGGRRLNYQRPDRN